MPILPRIFQVLKNHLVYSHRASRASQRLRSTSLTVFFFRTLARGDANLVLRNILLRLSESDSWQPFLTDLRVIFPQLDIQVQFKAKTDEFIDVKLKSTGEWVPLEIAGTGVLQATQILS